MKKDFTVECNVCKQHYENWIGSTPCCGSIAYLVNEDGETSQKVSLYTSVGAGIIDFGTKDEIREKEIKSKQEILLNFSDEFIRSEALYNPIVNHSLELLRRGEDVYKVMEFAMYAFVKQDNERYEIMEKLIENFHQPLMYSAEKE